MPIEVTVRHMEASQQVQNYARRKADELAEDFPRVEHVHIILDVEKRNHLVEVIVQGKNRIRAEAKEAAENLAAAIDSAVEKVEKQLRRYRDIESVAAELHFNRAVLRSPIHGDWRDALA